eukprot:scaffold12678_cov13-Tisochrysis_lutea.AAC.1
MAGGQAFFCSYKLYPASVELFDRTSPCINAAKKDVWACGTQWFGALTKLTSLVLLIPQNLSSQEKHVCLPTLQFTSKVAVLEDPTISQILEGASGFRGWKVLCEDIFEADNCEDVSVLIAASANNEVCES